MKRLYVGCRVRLVGPWAGAPERNPVGSEGVIVEAGGTSRKGTKHHDWAVEIPGRDRRVVANSHELEPILYDGNQLVSWSDCAWRPDGVAA